VPVAREPRTLSFDFGALGAEEEPQFRRPRAWLAAAFATGPMVAVTLWVVARGEHLQRPAAAAAYWGYLIAASMLIGLYWWHRRPASRFGPLLVLFGVLVWVVSWQGAQASLPFAAGVLVEGPTFILTIYLFLAFPMGRLEPQVARWLMYAVVFAVVAFFLPWALFSPVIAGGGPLTSCVPNCPPNSLQIATAPQLVEVAGKLETYIALIVVPCVIVVYARRLLTASRPQRRALLAVAVTSLLFLPAYWVANFAAWILHVEPALVRTLQWGIVATRVLLPIGFLIALLQARGFAARAQQALLEQLAARPSPERWRDAVAGALDDPTLRLGYHDPMSGRFRDAAGDTLPTPGLGDPRVWVTIGQDGQAVAAMAADETLAEDPELVRATASATLVAVENGALEGELRASQSRIREAGQAERERIGRDLHDSAQQRLIALRIRLTLLGEQLGAPEDRAALERLGEEVDHTLHELRDIANGVTPAVLADRGVGPALEAVARRSPIRISVYDSGIGRPPEAVEAAVYYSCLECLQNAAKHAGPDAFVAIHLARDEAHVNFSIEDNGAGFEPGQVRRGSGLANLQDRVTALGGHVRIEAHAGAGTRVSGAVPV
jgi:signal transduction histidine kinase